MTILSRNFYLFLGFHSFLLGLFPFFLPVYLFKNGSTLAEISWFIALTGIGFCLGLWFLDRLRSRFCLWPILVSFVLELVLLVLLFGQAPLPVIALVNGGYSCFFWTIQRILFLAGGSSADSGRRFGNFQIYVLLVLKSGILVGGILLDSGGTSAVLLLTLLVGSLGSGIFWRSGRHMEFPEQMQRQKPLSVGKIVRFSDQFRSKLIFAIDGLFLYLESYFWIISIFLIVGESFTKLGLVVIGVAVILGLVFYLIKNTIDSLDNQKVYSWAVLLYMLSWGLRASLSPGMELSLQLSLLLLVAFCTSFFRLAFNKRFFDVAQKSSMYHYLFVKSYYSQLFLALGFALVGLVSLGGVGGISILSSCYWCAAIVSGLYWFYLLDDRLAKNTQIKGVPE